MLSLGFVLVSVAVCEWPTSKFITLYMHNVGQ